MQKKKRKHVATVDSAELELLNNTLASTAWKN